jgi:hypothetical protein
MKTLLVGYQGAPVPSALKPGNQLLHDRQLDLDVPDEMVTLALEAPSHASQEPVEPFKRVAIP